MKKLISMLLVLCMVLTLAPAALAAESTAETTEENTNTYFTDQYHDQDIDLETLEITPLTSEDAVTLVKALNDILKKSSSTDEDVETAFKAVTDAYTTAFTNYELLYFRSTMDVTNSELVEQSSEYYNLGVELSDQVCLSAKAILNSKHADYFIEAERLTEEDVEYYTAYEAMTDEEKSLAAEMQAIEPEYSAAYAAEMSAEVDGKEWTIDTLNAAYEEGTVADEEYENILNEIYLSYYEGLGDIFLKMLEIGSRIAVFYDYDNFADYGYPNKYGRDFTPAEIQEYCDAVKEYIVPLAGEMEKIYSMDAYSASYEDYSAYAYGDYTTEETLDLVETYINKLSSEMGEAFAYMREHNLIDIAYSENKDTGAYTYILEKYGAPYLFSSPNGWMTDFSTIVHEFGHYNNFYWHPFGWNDASAVTDLAEVHSQGLELLFTQFYDEIFGEGLAKLGKDMVMVSILSDAIINGSMLGELEIYAHSTPGVTFEDLCDKYAELCDEYQVGGSDPYWWVTVPHLTVQPLYYISYSVSAAGACIFWLDAQEKGWDVALDEYLRFVAQDPALGFQEQFENMGLDNPLSPEFLKDLSSELFIALDVDARTHPQLFNDVDRDDPNFDSITALATRGLISGDGTGNFNPDDDATRAVFIQMLYNAFAQKGDENENPLTDIEGKWYEDAAAWAFTRNIITGSYDLNGTLVFNGDETADEQTMAVLMCRIIKLFGISDCVPSEEHEYTDSDQIADWAKSSVDFLYESGILETDEQGNIGPTQVLSRRELASVIYMLFSMVNS